MGQAGTRTCDPLVRLVLDLFFGVRHHPGLTLEVTFLSYAQALETYDYRRRRKPGKLSLAERMASVLGQCRSVSKRIVGSDPDAESAFIDDFKNSRNYYTHYNPKREKKAAKGANLYLLHHPAAGAAGNVAPSPARLRVPSD